MTINEHKQKKDFLKHIFEIEKNKKEDLDLWRGRNKQDLHKGETLFIEN